MKKGLKVILFNVVVVLFFFGILELGIGLILNNPSYIPAKLLKGFQNYYIHYDRDIVQYLPESAVYDKELTYKLKPGKSTFKNREFNTTYNVNTFGLRDDEISLKNPEIIVLGDSHAMGWGVEQDETFAQIIEEETGFTVLNAGISSYGTAREFMLLEQLNTANLKYLIIQYCENDYNENKRLFNSPKKKLKIASEDSYNKRRQKHKKATKYYLFKHCIKILGGVNKPKRRKSNVTKKEARVFLNMIMKYKKLLGDTKIVVFSIDGRQSTDLMQKALQKELMDKKFAFLKDKITVLEFSNELSQDKYFVLDDHINTFGHQAIATKVIDVINSKDLE